MYRNMSNNEDDLFRQINKNTGKTRKFNSEHYCWEAQHPILNSIQDWPQRGYYLLLFPLFLVSVLTLSFFRESLEIYSNQSMPERVNQENYNFSARNIGSIQDQVIIFLIIFYFFKENIDLFLSICQ